MPFQNTAAIYILILSCGTVGMAPTYLSSAENVVTVHLEAFSLWDSSSAHVDYHCELLDAVLTTHDTFSVEVDGRAFSPRHLGAIPTFRKLAELCRSRYRGKLASITIYQTPALLRIVAEQLRPFIGTQTWGKIAFK